MRKNIIAIIGFCLILILFGTALIAIVNCLSQKIYIKENVLIALIAALSTIVTITGAIFTNKFLKNEELLKEKEMEFLKIKREFYHEYLQQFIMHISYRNSGLHWTDEAKENEKNLLISKIRLPIYASKELINFFNKEGTDFTEMYKLIRTDLMESNLEKLNGLNQINVYLPRIVLNESIKGQIEKVKIDYNEFKESELYNEFVRFISLDSNLQNGLVQTESNKIVMNKLRMKRILDYKTDNNTFRLSEVGENYFNLYKLDILYSANNNPQTL